MLQRFATSYAAGLPQFQEALASNSPEALATACHSLRGASASIGATRIEALAGELESLGTWQGAHAEVAERTMALEALLVDTAHRPSEALGIKA